MQLDRSLDNLDNILSTELSSSNGVQLSQQLVEAEAWGAWLSDQYREAERLLSELRNKAYDPSGATVLERELSLEARVAPYQQTVDRLKDRADILTRRISLGQTILRSLRSELENRHVAV